MPECIGLYYSEGFVYKDTARFNDDVLNSGVVLYEVIRVWNGTALFLEDHTRRLQESVSLMGYHYTVEIPVLHYLLRNLIRRNNLSDGNVKIVLQFDANHHPVIYNYLIPHLYPTPEMYKTGVETDLFMASRSNPNVKRMLPGIRGQVTDFILAGNLYDALLVADDESITEGSRTNVFFIREGSVYTPPGDKVLKGITREKIIDLCNKLHYKLIEQTIRIGTLHDFEAAFFTGTSPKVLPIRRIAHVGYDVSNPLMNALMTGYDNMIASYIHHWHDIYRH